MLLIKALMYRAGLLPAGEQEYLSWLVLIHERRLAEYDALLLW